MARQINRAPAHAQFAGDSFDAKALPAGKEGFHVSVGKPLVRKAGGKSELVVPVTFQDGKAKVEYEIAW